MKVKQFKMQVTPEQSEIVQKRLFELGYVWFNGDNKVILTDKPILAINTIDKDICWADKLNDVNLTFEQFKEKYMEFELPEKWCVKGSDSIEDTIIRKWFYDNQKTKGFFTFDFVIGVYYLSDNLIKTSWTPQGFYFPKGYTEITFDQFKKYVLKEEAMETELKVTKEYVLELAKLYPETRDKLKVIFPNVFEDDKYLEIPFEQDGIIDSNYIILAETRAFGKFKEKAIYLNGDYNWEIFNDDGADILIPTKKQ